MLAPQVGLGAQSRPGDQISRSQAETESTERGEKALESVRGGGQTALRPGSRTMMPNRVATQKSGCGKSRHRLVDGSRERRPRQDFAKSPIGTRVARGTRSVVGHYRHANRLTRTSCRGFVARSQKQEGDFSSMRLRKGGLIKSLATVATEMRLLDQDRLR
jgi:hypothetical protein